MKKYRSLISNTILLTFSILFITGYMMFLWPPRGQAPRGYSMLGFHKGELKAIHNMLSHLSVPFMLAHLWLNIKAIKNYMGDKKKLMLNIILPLLMVSFFVFFALFSR